MKTIEDIPWTSNIPEDWKIYPLFYYFEENKKKNISMAEDNLLSLSYGRIVQKDIETSFGLLPQSFETYQVVEKGFIVLRLTDLQNDKRSLRVGLVTQKGIITSAYVGLKKRKKVSSRYIYQLLHSYDLQKVFYNLGGGLRQSLRYAELKKLPIIIPPPETQKLISHFLDKETTRIDTLIAKKQKQIKLLQEKRQAIITHAVTKGLKPDVKMKDSGVEWIGEIPEHWELKPLKRVCLLQRGVDLSSDEMVEGEYPVGGSNGPIGTHNEYNVEGPSMTVGRSGSVGEVNYYYSNFFAHNTSLYVNQIFNSAPRFVYYLLLSMKLKDFSAGTAVGTLNRNLLHPLYVPYPSTDEQKLIASYLDKNLNKNNNLIAKIHKSIALLKEYRSSLITHAVTGQIDINKLEV